MPRYVDKEIFEDILLKKKKLAGSPGYYDQRRKLIIDDVRSIGDVYSFWIENPILRRSLLNENKSSKTLRKEALRGIQQVHNAWYFLYDLSRKNLPFVDQLNPTLIKRTNGLVMGDRENNYRNKLVTLNCPDYTPPNFVKIDKKIKEAISRVKQIHSYNPLEAAITANLEISGIQPFMDGNKRVARLVQDRILYDFGLPPAIVPAGEGKYFRNLLCKTLPHYDSGNVDGQRDFYNYFASKVNNSLDEVLGDLVLEPK